jgi:hypothetical protein
MRPSPRNCSAIIVFSLCAVVASVLPAIAGEKPTVIEIQGATILALNATVDEDTVSLPINLADDAVADGVKVLQVLLDNQRGTWSDAFTASFDRPPDGAPPTHLRITGNLNKANRPGTYIVVLEITGHRKSANNGKPGSQPQSGVTIRQEQQLSLSRPEAQLVAEGQKVVESVIWTPLGGRTLPTPTLTIREKSGLSNVTLTLTEADAVRADSGIATGKLVPVAPASSPEPSQRIIPAGGSTKIEYRLDGTFPVGTCRASVELSSPQLKAPTVVTYEVRSRILWAWVPALILLGLIFGALLRKYLPAMIASGELQVAGAQALAEMDMRLSDPDDTLRTEVVEIHRELKNMLDGKPEALTKDHIDAAKDKLTKALEAKENRRRDAETRLGAVRNLLNTKLMLPADVEGLLGPLRAQYQMAAKYQEEGNFSAALKQIAAALEVPKPKLRGAMHDWLIGVGQVRVGLSSHNYWPSYLHELVEDGGKKINEATSRSTLTDPEKNDPLETIADVDALQRFLRDLLAQLAGWVKKEADPVEEWLEKLPNRPIKLDPVLKGLGDELSKLARLGDGLTEPKPSEIPDSMREVLSCVQAALLGACDLLTANDKPHVEDLVQKCQYLEALAELKRLVPGPPHAVPAGALSFARGGRPLATSQTSASLGNVRRAPGLGAPLPPLVEKSADYQARAEKKLRRAQRVQYVLAAIVLLGIGCTAVGSDFVGTSKELLGLFFWGFATDVSVAVATDLATKRRS